MSKAAELAKMGEVLTNGQIGGRRNIVINGAMKISQRSTSVSSITATGYHALDRFKLLYTDAGTWTMSQSSTTPNGFANSLKLDCTSAKSSLASDSRLFLMTSIEGQDVQQFKKGTSDAEQYTLSFHVRSNKTGTYQVNIEDNDNIRIVGSTYTISSADTWEKKEITFVADQTGAFADDNGDSLAIMWALVAGTDNSSGAVPTAWEAKSNTDRGAGLNINLADSTSNEWYITGVQLEVGSTATPFEHRSFGEELQLCKRYCNVIAPINDEAFTFGHARTTTIAVGTVRLHPVMRANPTITFSDVTDFQIQFGNGATQTTGMGANELSTEGITMQATIGSGLTVGQGMEIREHTSGAKITVDAEL